MIYVIYVFFEVYKNVCDDGKKRDRNSLVEKGILVILWENIVIVGYDYWEGIIFFNWMIEILVL